MWKIHLRFLFAACGNKTFSSFSWIPLKMNCKCFNSLKMIFSQILHCSHHASLPTREKCQIFDYERGGNAWQSPHSRNMLSSQKKNFQKRGKILSLESRSPNKTRTNFAYELQVFRKLRVGMIKSQIYSQSAGKVVDKIWKQKRMLVKTCIKRVLTLDFYCITKKKHMKTYERKKCSTKIMQKLKIL